MSNWWGRRSRGVERRPKLGVRGAASSPLRDGDSATSFAAGLAHAIEGRLDNAESTLTAALVQDPGNAEGHNNLGLVFQRKGQIEEAIGCFQRATAIRPTYGVALVNLGAAHAALDRHEEAAEFYRTALQIDPANISALNNLGASLHVLGRDDEAIGPLEAAVTAAPDLVDARANLGRALSAVGRSADAIAQFRAALNARPDNADLHLEQARLLHQADFHAEAIVHYQRACELAPEMAGPHAGLGKVLQEVGRLDEARSSLRRAIAADPSGLGHYLNLAHITKFAEGDPALLTMLDRVAKVDALSDDDRINLHFALGKALADVGRHDESFTHLIAGNAARRRHSDYDERRALKSLQRVKDVMSADRLATWPRIGSPTSAPIFIVGMPRSGSTLVEQILASHPQVASAGEVNALREALKQHAGEAPDWRYPDAAFIPTDRDLEKIAERYLALLDQAALVSRGRDAPERITDKMLGNFRHVGLISRLFPNARIIHTFRDPIETCLSCFSINFASQPFTFDLGELGRYYRAYAIVMRHWKKTLPEGTIFDVRYEAVAQDFERSARAIVAHCGLDWHDDCLRFFETDRPVKTASVAQVRRPIYSSSVRRWRPDKQTLQPLFEGLGLRASD